MLEMRWPHLLSQLREKGRLCHSLEARLKREERLMMTNLEERVSAYFAKGREKGQHGHMLERGDPCPLARKRERALDLRNFS